MKRNLLTLLLVCFCTTGLFAENPLFKPGMKLLYKVESFGSYNFAVKPLQVAPDLKFAWNMSHREDMYGHVTISKDALATATKQMNEFEGGDAELTDMTTVVLSTAVYKSLKAGKPTTMNTGSGDKVFRMKETQSYKFKMDGKDAEKKVLYIESEDGKEKLWMMDDALPLILKMSLSGFSINLDEAITEKPVDNVMALEGKNLLTSPEAQVIWNRIRKCSWEEVTDNTEDGEGMFREYFCPIEGIRILTTNDTITYVMLYNKGAEQVDFIWDATDAVLPYGLKLNMTRQDVEKLMGPTEEQAKNRVHYPQSVAYDKKKVTIEYFMDDEEAPPQPTDKVKMMSLF